jgi:hypothetical protein
LFASAHAIISASRILANIFISFSLTAASTFTCHL